MRLRILMVTLVVLVPHTKAYAPPSCAATSGTFASPGSTDMPQPTWVIGKELSAAEIGADLDRFRSHGLCEIVVVPELGPNRDMRPDDLRGPLFGFFFSQLGKILDEAAARGMRIWVESFQKIDHENVAAKDHPEFVGQALAETSRGSYQIQESDFDRLDPDAIDAFIAAYYAQFESRWPAYFGTTLAGFWDDESVIIRSASEGAAVRPWSHALPATFLAAKGYSIDVPARQEQLFHGTDAASRKTRTDYWDVVSDMHRAAYQRQSDWLAARGVKLVVQPLADEGRVTDDIYAEGDVFAMYGGASVPGSDMLFNNDDSGGIGQTNMGLVLKQTSSAAHLGGKAEAQHEPFGWSQPSLAHMRSYTDRMFVRGITLVHHAFFTQYGASPADVNAHLLAPDLFHRNVFWDDEPAYDTYAARLRNMLRSAAPVNDTLLLYPIASTVAQDPETVDETWQNAYQNLGTALIDAHRGFDIVWEDVIPSSPTTYNTIVLPAAMALHDATATKLASFVSAGGHVIAVGRIPHLSAEGNDATLRSAMQSIFGTDPTLPIAAGVVQNGRAITVGADFTSTTDFSRDTRGRYAVFWDALDRTGVRDATLEPERLLHTSTITSSAGAVIPETGQDHTANEVLHFRRGGKDGYWITNSPDNYVRPVDAASRQTPTQEPLTTVVTVPVAAGVPQIWNPEDGSIVDALAWWRVGTDKTAIEVSFPGQGGRGIVFREGAEKCHVTAPNTGVTSIACKSGVVTVSADWPAKPASRTIPVWCPNGVASVALTTTRDLPTTTVAGPWLFTLAGVPQLRGPGTWTEPDVSTGAPALPGITGTGAYETTAAGTGALDVPASHLAPDVRLELDLGMVRDVSALTVNATSAGRKVWPGYVHDVTSAVHAGTNNLRIEVTNTQANSTPGPGYAPLRASGLLTAPKLIPRVRVSGSAMLTSPTPPPSPVPGVQLLTNPSFETSGPAGWTTDGVAFMRVRADAAHSGTSSAEVRAPVAPGAYWTQTVPIVGGADYALSSWVLVQGTAPSTGARLAVRWLDDAGAVIAEQLGPKRFEDTSWLQLSWALRAPSNAERVQVRVGIDVSIMTLGAAAFDDVELVGPPG